MKKLAVLFAILGLFAAGAASADGNIAFIEGDGVLAPGGDTNPCPGSVLTHNHDGSTENAFTWQLQGVQAPDYGAFAEGYPDLDGNVCGIQLLLTRWGTMGGTGTIDVYVWAFDAGTQNPGGVLSMTQSQAVSGVGYWPTVMQHDFDNTDAASAGFFVGYWPRSFVGILANFGCAMDQDGFGGYPRTNIAPGIGYPTGWSHPSSVGYQLQAFGIGPYLGATPTENTSWGQIKNLYN